MSDVFNIVVLPLHDWKKCEAEGFRTRDGHLLLEFAKNPRVKKILVINRPLSFTEALLKKRKWRVNGELINKFHRFSWLSQVMPEVYSLDQVCEW